MVFLLRSPSGFTNIFCRIRQRKHVETASYSEKPLTCSINPIFSKRTLCGRDNEQHSLCRVTASSHVCAFVCVPRANSSTNGTKPSGSGNRAANSAKARSDTTTESAQRAIEQ